MWKTKGHDSIIDFIKYSIESDRLAHAYLISGTSYIGKTTLAFDIARAVNCLEFMKHNAPCGECKTCLRIINNIHTDIHFLDFLNFTSSPIEQLRENFISKVNKKPYEGGSQVFIISHVDKMRSEHANLLLKTLEEPPQDVVIILMCEDTSMILDTILSRCQILELYPVLDPAFLEKLIAVAAGTFFPDSLDPKLIVRLSRGRIGWIYRVISDPEIFFSMQKLFDDMEFAIETSVEDRLKFSNGLVKKNKTIQFDGFSDIDIMLTWWRDLMMLSVGNKSDVININRLDYLENISSHFSTGQIVDVIKMFNLAKFNLSINANPLLVYDNLLLNIPSKDYK